MSIATSLKCRLFWDFGEDFGDEPGDFFFCDFGDELGETVTEPAFVVWSVKLDPIDPFIRSAMDLERGERDPALARAAKHMRIVKNFVRFHPHLYQDLVPR